MDQVRLVGTDQEDKVPVDQPLHIVSRNEANLALVILIIEMKMETRRSLLFLLCPAMVDNPRFYRGKQKALVKIRTAS